jgi:hypothetical protein
MMALYYFSRCIIHYYYLQDQEKNENDMWPQYACNDRPFPKCGIVFIRRIGQKLSRGKLMAGLDI